MRTTQLVGLNFWADLWVKNQKLIFTKQIEICKGMFEEPVYGMYYEFEPPYPDVNLKLIVIEELQVSPWSSGPMIFSHLKATLIKRTGQECDCGYYFSWMVDPSLRGKDFDYETGRYYV